MTGFFLSNSGIRVSRPGAFPVRSAHNAWVQAGVGGGFPARAAALRSMASLSTLVLALLVPASPACADTVPNDGAAMAAERASDAGSENGDAQQNSGNRADVLTALFDNQIVVIGNRAIIAQLADIEPEQNYDEDRIASYGANTVGELVDQIRSENGDDQPALLVNGQPVGDIGDIADYPVEAVRRIEALPRGSAARVGGGSTQRAYNIVLKPSVKTVTVTGSREWATEGDWALSKAEAQLTYVRKRDRINLSIRASQSDDLFEADRNLIRPEATTPFAPQGNVIPFRGTEIDPAFSALAGTTVTTIALPNAPTMPTLDSLLPYAQKTNGSRIGEFRTLRGASRPIEASIAGNKTLTPWLSLSINGRLNRSRSASYNGLPSARFLLPADHPASPFTVPVILALSDADRPLRYDTQTDSNSLTASLIANRGSWQATLQGRYEERERRSASSLTGSIPGGFITIEPDTDPFSGALANRIPVSVRRTRSKTSTREARLDVQGPLLKLPAGDLQLRAGASITGSKLSGTDFNGQAIGLTRNEWNLRGGVTIPLTTRGGFLGSVGDSDISADFSRQDLGRFGKLDEHSVAFNWRPLAWLRLSASDNTDGRPIPLELVSAPSVIAENVLYFDPLRGETVPITTIYGGGGNLKNETQRLRTLSLSASPWARYKLQLNADYSISDTRNQFGALPLPTSAVVQAFPDRFVRDASGRLVLVDSRTVNFEKLHTRQLRFNTSFAVPLEAVPLDAKGKPKLAGARWTMQVNASHTILLESTSVIRAGLGEIDLLAGGAVGIGGGQQRHRSDASIAITRGATGFRLQASRTGESRLQYGLESMPNQLIFHPVVTFDLRAMADMGALLPKSPFWKRTRISLLVDNIGNTRQRVTAASGDLPLGFQPAYRDPIGRTVSLELRKVF